MQKYQEQVKAQLQKTDRDRNPFSAVRGEGIQRGAILGAQAIRPQTICADRSSLTTTAIEFMWFAEQRFRELGFQLLEANAVRGPFCADQS